MRTTKSKNSIAAIAERFVVESQVTLLDPPKRYQVQSIWCKNEHFHVQKLLVCVSQLENTTSTVAMPGPLKIYVSCRCCCCGFDQSFDFLVPLHWCLKVPLRRVKRYCCIHHWQVYSPLSKLQLPNCDYSTSGFITMVTVSDIYQP